MASETFGTPRPSHAALMDEVYRGQRHIYDLTRKYYLFGRDTLIAGLAAKPGARVLEVACGTGRNLAKVAKAWPGVRLYGLDISAEMLKSARATLGNEARLGEGDACSFDAQALLGELNDLSTAHALLGAVAAGPASALVVHWQQSLQARLDAGLLELPAMERLLEKTPTPWG